MCKEKKSKTLNLDEILYDTNKDLPAIVALILSICSELGIDIYFQSNAEQLEVICNYFEDGEDKQIIACAERDSNQMLQGD